MLWAICRWLADHGLSIESAHIDEVGGRASDRFVILGESDISGLRARLTCPSRRVIERAVDVGGADGRHPLPLDAAAAGVLFRRMDGDRSPSQLYLMPTRLIARGTGELAVRSPSEDEAGNHLQELVPVD